jgi:hypothetical protein
MFTEDIYDEISLTKDKSLSLKITGDFSPSLDGEENNFSPKGSQTIKRIHIIFPKGQK